MKLDDVMDELAGALAAITGLRVFAYPPPTVVPPAGIVSYPESVIYDQTYHRGMDRISALPVIVNYLNPAYSAYGVQPAADAHGGE